MTMTPDSPVEARLASSPAPPSSTTPDEDSPPSSSRSDDPEDDAPQTPDPPPPPAQPVRTTEPPPNFRIQGLFLVGPKPSIMVNGTSLCCGDELDGVEIREITRDSVTIAYSCAHNRGQGWDLRQISGFFDIDQHPTKMATLAAATRLFLRGDVRPANNEVVATLDAETENRLLLRASAWSLVDGAQRGVAAEAALVHRVALATEGRPVPLEVLRPDQVRIEGKRFVSDTGELTWDLSEAGRGVVTINTPRSKGVIGFGGGQRRERLGVQEVAGGKAAIEIGPEWRTVWYEIVIQ